MIRIRKDLLIKILFTLIIIFSNITGLLELLGGSMFAEGSIILLTFIMTFILLLKKRSYDLLDLGMIFIALYSIIISLFSVFYFDIEVTSLICLYSYTLPCLIFLCKDSLFLNKNTNFFFNIFLIMLTVNSLYAIYQFLTPNPLISLESMRATGLMKSTINYSGIIGCMFFSLLFYIKQNKWYYNILFLIIIFGAIFSQSRGLLANIILGFLLTPISVILINRKFNLKEFTKLLGIILSIILIFIIMYNFIENSEIFNKINRLMHIFDYKNDNANTLRIYYWSNFGKYFYNNPFGYGVGQIASGTSFVSNAVNFESYILDTIYSIGIISILYFYIPIYWIYKNVKNIPIEIQKYIHMFLIGILIQNAVQPVMLTPTTLIITWLTIIIFTNYICKNDFHYKKVGMHEKNINCMDK